MATVKTNGHYRFTLDSHEVPQKILDSEFDYLDSPDDTTFFKYKGQYYDLGEAMVTSIGDWHGIYTQSAFHAIVIKLDDCGERVLVGEVFS